MFDGWQSYKHMQSTEACVDHVKLSLYANTAAVNRVKLVLRAETSSKSQRLESLWWIKVSSRELSLLRQISGDSSDFCLLKKEEKQFSFLRQMELLYER